MAGTIRDTTHLPRRRSREKTGYIFMTNGDGGADLLKKLIVGNTTLNRLVAG